MPPSNNQSTDSVTSEKEANEVIFPIEVRTDRTTTVGALQKWTGPAALLLGLAALVASGIWLIGYLQKNPMAPPQKTGREASTRPAAVDSMSENKGGAVAANPSASENDTVAPAGSQPPAEIRRHAVSQEVLSLMGEGREHELQREYALARDAYRKAHRIDRDYEAATAALERVSAQIAQAESRQSLSAGLAALDRKEYDRARKYLVKARSLRPGAAETQAAMAKLNRAVRRDRIRILRQKGQTAEAAENWPAALKQYQSILALEPENESARRGIDRARNQLRVLADIQFYIDRPDALLRENDLKKARSVLLAGRALEPGGARLNQRLGRLEEMVAKAQRPVRVTIESDNQTRVDIYRVGRLGQFTEKELNLKPGVYTVVGHREGYQDVRHEIVIRPGQESRRITVICRVKV